MRPGPKIGYKQSAEHVSKRIRRVDPKDVQRRLRCRKCGFAWLYDGSTGTIAICPLCGAKKEARSRTDISRKYLADHPERGAALKVWLKANGRQHSKASAERVRQTVFALISKSKHPHCVSCGCDDLRFLEINHKNGGGGREYAEKKSQVVYRDIAMLRRPVDDLELLCRVCNAKHYLMLKFGTVPIEVTWKLSPTTTMETGS
jgi:hypothetical protein